MDVYQNVAKHDDGIMQDADGDIQLYVYEWTIEGFAKTSPSKKIFGPAISFETEHNTRMYLWLDLQYGGKNLFIGCHLESDSELQKFFKEFYVIIFFLDRDGNILHSFKYEKLDMHNIKSKVFGFCKADELPAISKDDSLIIRSKISVRSISSGSKESLISAGIMRLSKDLEILFNKRDFISDAIVKVGGEEVFVNKFILFCRCPVLQRLSMIDISNYDVSSGITRILNGHSYISRHLDSNISLTVTQAHPDIVEIENENADVFRSALSYMYCGRILSLHIKNCFKLYRLARKLELRELIMWLEPTQIRSKAKVIAEKKSCNFKIQRFTSRSRENSVSSRIFHTSIGEKMSWKVKLAYLSDADKVHITLHKLFTTKFGIQAALKLFVQKEGKIYRSLGEFCNFFPSNSRIKSCPKLTDKNSQLSIAKDDLFGDTLTIYCELSIALGEVEAQEDRSFPHNSDGLHLNFLSKRLRVLLDTAKFSDFSLVVCDEMYKVHRAMLLVRAPILARSLLELPNSNTTHMNVSPIILANFKSLILYIYTGELDNLDMKNVEAFYYAAEELQLPELSEKCLQYILSAMNTENACKIFVFANEQKNQALRNEVKRFICERSSEILISPAGLQLQASYPQLALEILESVTPIHDFSK